MFLPSTLCRATIYSIDEKKKYEKKMIRALPATV